MAENQFITRASEASPEWTRRQNEIQARQMMSPAFLRAAAISERAQREKRIEDNALRAQQLERDKMDARALHDKNVLDHQIAATNQRKADLADEAAFNAHLVDLQSKMNVLSPEFHKAVIALGVAHPAAAHMDLARKIIEHSNSELSRRGVDPELATAHAELNHVLQSQDVITPLQRQERLDAVREKYPHILDKSPGFREAFKSAEQRIRPAAVIPENMPQTGMTVRDPITGATSSYHVPPAVKAPSPTAMTPEQKQEAYRKAITGGSVVFGNYSTDGSKFEKDSGKTDWTHAKVSYLDPISGRPQTDKYIPRGQWEQLTAPANQAAVPDTTATPDSSSSDVTPAPDTTVPIAAPKPIRMKYVDGNLVEDK